MLIRLSRVRHEELRDLIGDAWRHVSLGIVEAHLNGNGYGNGNGNGYGNQGCNGNNFGGFGHHHHHDFY